MFRLHFDTQIGAWVIQFLQLGFIWVTVRDGKSKLTFETLLAANAFVTRSGIGDHYDEFIVKGMSAYVHGVRV